MPSGIGGSLDQRILDKVEVVERHFHGNEIWFGDGAVEDSLTPYTLVSSDGGFGPAVELLAPGDTPFVAGNTRFDPHRILPTRIDTATLYLIRLIWDAVSVIAGESARRYTTIPIFPTGVGANIDGTIADTLAMRAYSATDYLWAKCKNATDVAEVDIIIGIHEYPK